MFTLMMQMSRLQEQIRTGSVEKKKEAIRELASVNINGKMKNLFYRALVKYDWFKQLPVEVLLDFFKFHHQKGTPQSRECVKGSLIDCLLCVFNQGDEKAKLNAMLSLGEIKNLSRSQANRYREHFEDIRRLSASELLTFYIALTGSDIGTAQISSELEIFLMGLLAKVLDHFNGKYKGKLVERSLAIRYLFKNHHDDEFQYIRGIEHLTRTSCGQLAEDGEVNEFEQEIYRKIEVERDRKDSELPSPAPACIRMFDKARDLEAKARPAGKSSQEGRDKLRGNFHELL